MTHTETLDVEFSKEFAADLQPVLTAVLGTDCPMELRDSRIVIRADTNRVIYIDVRAMILSGTVRLRRPERSKVRPVRRGKLRAVK